MREGFFFPDFGRQGFETFVHTPIQGQSFGSVNFGDEMT